MKTWKSRIIVLIITILVLITLPAMVYPVVNDFTPEKRTELFFSFVLNLFGTIVGAGLAYFFALSQFKVQSNAEIEKNQVDTAFSFHE